MAATVHILALLASLDLVSSGPLCWFVDCKLSHTIHCLLTQLTFASSINGILISVFPSRTILLGFWIYFPIQFKT